MPVYTVHGPIAATTNRWNAERVVLVRDGFSIWAFLLGPFWLAWHRLWLALLGYLVVTIATAVAMAVLDVAPGARMLVTVLITVLTGLEAASLQRWTLSRRQWRQLDLVVAEDRDGAERRFFDRWTGTPRQADPHDRGAPPPLRNPALRASAAPHDDIIGLFPQPGGASR